MTKKQKPLIGVLPLFDGNYQNIWMFPGYTDAIIESGGIPLVLNLLDDSRDIDRLGDQLDGFLFTGGQDIHPGEYGQLALPFLKEFYPPRDLMEKKLLESIMIRDKPVLGVCRGLQLINSALGGKLYQDIPQQMDSEIKVLHQQQGQYKFPAHPVYIKKNSFLYELLGKEELMVNSMHHQGISVLSDRLLANAFSDDGLIEAVTIPELTFGLAVQWHPEFLWQDSHLHLRLFQAFVNAARG